MSGSTISRFVVLVGIALGALLFCNCGGDDNSSSTDPPTDPPEACAITLTGPTSSDIFMSKISSDVNDDLLKIYWDAAGGGEVRIDLLRAGQFLDVLIDSTVNDGFMSCHIASLDLTPGNDYQVQVSSLSDEVCGDVSEEFTVYDPDSCHMSILVGIDGAIGDPVHVGDDVDIYFEAMEGTGAVDIELWYNYGNWSQYDDVALVGTIVSNYSGPAPYAWHASTLGWVVYHDYFIRVVDSRVPGCYRNSTIVNIVQ